MVEGLHRLALVYELTQTFCPNFILYYLVFDLLVFVSAQVEGQALLGFKSSLFVTHDVYRFMVMLVGYFGVVGITQLTSYGFKTLVTFLFSLRWWMLSLKQYDSKEYSSTGWSLLKAGIVMAIVESIYVWSEFE